MLFAVKNKGAILYTAPPLNVKKISYVKHIKTIISSICCTTAKGSQKPKKKGFIQYE